jgi:hypothetical protein
LRADVVPLLVETCWIVAGKEDVEQVIEGDSRRIELDLDDFCVPGPLAAYRLVIRIRVVATDLSALDERHTDELPKHCVEAPEASTAEYCRLHGQSSLDVTVSRTGSPY